MAVLTLNGITVPAALDEVTRLQPRLIGEEGEAFSGADLSNVRGYKEGWRARLIPQTAAAGAAFRALVQGRGFTFSYDSDLYADRKGLGPTSGTSLASPNNGSAISQFITGGASTGKYSGALYLGGGTLSYPVGAGTDWTILGWMWASGAWHHYIRASSGSKWKDGVSTGDTLYFNVSGTALVFTTPAAPYSAWAPSHAYASGDRVLEGGKVFEVSSSTSGTNTVEPNWASAPNLFDEVEEDPGSLEGGPWTWINLGTGVPTAFDDVMFLPYAIPEAWAALLYAEANARAWTGLPRLRLAGDAAAGLAGGFTTVVGKVGDAKLVRANLGGSLARNADPFELELREA